MDFKEIEKGAVWNADDYEKRFDLTIDRHFAVMKLVEELGEFTQAVLIHEGRCRPEKKCDEEASKREVALELADVLGMTIVCADRFGIDLEQALGEKWLKRYKEAHQ